MIATGTRVLTYHQARNEAVVELLEADERVFLIGGTLGGPFEPPTGIPQRAGPDRIFAGPVCELGYVGLAVGAAAAGQRPIVDVRAASFLFNGWEQLVNEAANLRYMSGGQVSIPMLVHVLSGARGSAGPQHSHSPQPMLMNTPGLKIIEPGTPYDVKGLIHAAMADGNPVIFSDHLQLNDLQGDVPTGPYVVPLGKADVKRPGRDVTVVASAVTLHRALDAAAAVAPLGVDVEVVDLRTLVPLDRDAIVASVARTGRLVVAHESHLTCGVASEVAATVAETIPGVLKAPVRRVATADVPHPFSPVLEAAITPTTERIKNAILETVGLLNADDTVRA